MHKEGVGLGRGGRERESRAYGRGGTWKRGTGMGIKGVREGVGLEGGERGRGARGT